MQLEYKWMEAFFSSNGKSYSVNIDMKENIFCTKTIHALVL